MDATTHREPIAVAPGVDELADQRECRCGRPACPACGGCLSAEIGCDWCACTISAEEQLAIIDAIDHRARLRRLHGRA